MEDALVRGRAGHPSIIGDDVLVRPHAHLNGVRAGDGCFLATGAALFPGSVVGAGAEVLIHAVVQVNTVLPPTATTASSTRRGPAAPAIRTCRRPRLDRIRRELVQPRSAAGD
jgi:carbonic anhydrase/acetyltransferase-like protein (isoleucine patch superfamily)